MIKIIMYGSNACGDCLDAIKVLDEMNAQYTYIEFSESTINLKRFLKLRDTNPLFDEVKKAGNIGIPCFLLSDGAVTLDLQEVTNKLTQ